MISGGSDVGDAEGLTEGGPGRGGELGAPVGSQGGRNTKTGDPGGQGSDAISGGGRPEWIGGWPTSRAIHNCKEVAEPVNSRERTNQVDVDMAEPAGRDRDLADRRSDMPGHLRLLAGEAGGGPSLDVSVHAGPQESGGDETAGTSNTRVRKGVQGVESPSAEGRREKRPVRPSGGRTEKRCAVSQKAPDNLKFLVLGQNRCGGA